MSLDTAVSLQASRDNLVALVEQQTAAWLAAGCPPSFSVDGESYSWNEWLAGKLQAIEQLQGLIQRVGSGPFVVRSRGRA